MINGSVWLGTMFGASLSLLLLDKEGDVAKALTAHDEEAPTPA